MSIKIFADAGSNLFKEFLDDNELDINVLTMTLDVNGKVYHCYKDNIDVNDFSKNFYEDMRKGAKIKTSLVNPNEMYESFKKEVEAGNQIIMVTMSKNISGTNQSANIAKEMIEDEFNKDVIRIIDSKTCGFGEGMVAIKAARLAKEIDDLDEIFEKCNKYVDTVCSEFTVEDLKYLNKTGRIPKSIVYVASLLNIKPLLKGDITGNIVSVGRCHGRNMSIKNLAKLCINNILDKDSIVYITHCDSPNDAIKLKDILVENGINNIKIYFYDLISGAHVGPGALALFYEGKKR